MNTNALFEAYRLQERQGPQVSMTVPYEFDGTAS